MDGRMAVIGARALVTYLAVVAGVCLLAFIGLCFYDLYLEGDDVE